ncbi:MAG: MscL family protein [Candidatus Hadarchaeales archaeon]
MPRDEEILKVLREIKALLEPKPAPPAPPRKGMRQEFMEFLKKYKVMGLAVAFIMGVYLGALVQSLAKDLILPLIGLMVPGLGNLSTLKIAVPPTPLDAQGNPIDPSWSGQLFGVGNFLSALITFIIVAFVIFLIVKVVSKWGVE